MAMELKHLNPQHVMDVTGKAIDEISRLRAENERLNNALDKECSETIKYMDELCNAKNEIERLTIDKRNDELRADVADATVEKLKAENAELKQKLEDAQATAYAESVDAGMRERRLKRALWLARASEAEKEVNYWTCQDESSYAIVDFNVRHETIVSYKAPHHRPYKWILIWENVERKCRAKAESYL